VSAAAYRARSATELIDATIQILRRNFATFYTLSALFTVPFYVIPPLLMPQSARGTVATPSVFSATALIVFFLLFIVLSAIFQTALFLASSDAYLGKPVVVADAISRAMKRAAGMAVGYIYQSFAVGLASLLFLIPGIYVALGLFAMPCIIALEGLSAGDAASRSFELSKGLKGHVFLTGLVGLVIYIVGFLIVFTIAGLAGGFGSQTLISQIISALGASALLPLGPITITLLYYDARIRKEGYDIELMAQQTGGPGAPPAKPQPA
jgi:hypothetical protein